MLIPFILNIPVIAGICFFFYKRFSSEPLKKFYWSALSFKIIAGIAVGLTYTYYYNYGPGEGDTLLFHDESVKLTQILYSDVNEFKNIFFYNTPSSSSQSLFRIAGDPRAFFFVKLLSLLNVITWSNYWINGIYLSLFCFLGIFTLANTLSKTVTISPAALCFSFFLLPSFVFWSSGVLKESAVIGCMGFCISWFLTVKSKKKKATIGNILLVVLLLYLGYKIKYYYILVMAGILFTWWLTDIIAFALKWEKNSYKIITYLMLLIGFSCIVIQLPILNVQLILDQMYYSYDLILKASEPANTFTFTHLEPTLSSYLIHFPKAAIVGIFRPLPGETNGIAGLGIALENLFLLLLLLGTISTMIKEKKASINLPLIAVITYIIILAALMAFIAPNWGTLSRYKVGFNMFIALLFTMHNSYFENLLKKIIPPKEKELY